MQKKYKNQICILVVQKKFKKFNFKFKSLFIFIYLHLHLIYRQYRIFSIAHNLEIEMNLSLFYYNIFNYTSIIYRNLILSSNIYY